MGKGERDKNVGYNVHKGVYYTFQLIAIKAFAETELTALVINTIVIYIKYVKM